MSIDQALQSTSEGTIITIYVVPGSTATRFPVSYNTWRKCIEMKVHAQAQENQANQEVCKVCAAFFDIPLKKVTLISGHTSREKRVLLQGIQNNQVSKRLEEALHGL